MIVGNKKIGRIISVRFFLLRASTFHFFLPEQRCPDHCTGASHPTLNSDRSRNAILLARTTFHASRRMSQDGFTPIHFENCMRADFHAFGTAIAKFRVIHKSIFQVSI
jgi:hypothetical protein